MSNTIQNERERVRKTKERGKTSERRKERERESVVVKFVLLLRNRLRPV